ncbi:MAG: hypothetical protein ABIQ10_15440 [Gemmatimonadaceae bacterium]
MSESRKKEFDVLLAEFERLGLDIGDLPGFARSGSLEPLIARVRAMEPGVTWHEVLPDLPKQFVPGRRETWPNKYRPVGDYDYPTPPAGPALHIHYDKNAPPNALEDFVALARSAGWPIYGAGLIYIENPKWPTTDAFVVLDKDTSEETFWAFEQWMEATTAMRTGVITREVHERQSYDD